MLNTRRLLALLPLYVLWAVGIDLFFDSSPLTKTGTKAVPAAVVVAFVLTSVAVVGICAWYLLQRGRGAVPDTRHNIYMAVLAGILVAGVVERILKALSAVLLGGQPWWALLPIYALGYLTCWAVLLAVLKRTQPHETSDN